MTKAGHKIPLTFSGKSHLLPPSSSSFSGRKKLIHQIADPAEGL